MNGSVEVRDFKVLLSKILLDNPWHREALEALHDVAPFAWITGGFVRGAIWDASYGKQDFSLPADIDVIYLETPRGSVLTERGLDRALYRLAPELHWSVRDQKRMHIRSNDRPYHSLDEALRGFPDRSSAVAVRLASKGGNDELEILAPFGLEDAFLGVVRPTPAALSDDRFQRFLGRKLPGWQKRWPSLRIAATLAARDQDTDRHAA